MKTLLILLMTVLLTTVIVVGCHVAGAGSPVSVSYDNQSSDLLAVSVTQPQDESVVRMTPLPVSGTVSAPAKVTVNGVSVEMSGNHFSTTVDLDPGPNSIDIMAMDTHGGQAFESVSVVYVP